MSIEPEWIDLTTIGSSYEEQMDARAARPTYRHRKRSFTGEAYGEWTLGRAPDVAPSRRPNATP